MATPQATMGPAPQPRSTLRPRAPELDFTDAIPRHWFRGSPLATHMANGVNLLFPAGERFFVRSVRHYLDRIDSAEQQADVRAFFGQEGRHAGAHERYNTLLEAQGFDVKGFLRPYERIAYGFVEPRTHPELRLSVTVALEHFTAIMAENALRDDLLADAHPAVRKLLLWHAAEEIEHKAVAFDVLKKVNPSYPLRMAGLLIATVGLGSAWFFATRHLLAQEDAATRAKARSEVHVLFTDQSVGRRVFWRGIREYIRRDFHPSQIDNGGLSRAYLAAQGMA